LGHGDLGIKG